MISRGKLTLEQYGYRFIRLNRFNIGRDPICTISEMLNKVIRNAGIRDTDALSR